MVPIVGATGVSCCLFHAVFDAKKKAVPKGRVPLRGIVAACEDVKMSCGARALTESCNINDLGVRYYFTSSEDLGMLRACQPSGSKKMKVFSFHRWWKME